jgi:hypothetical protein
MPRLTHHLPARLNTAYGRDSFRGQGPALSALRRAGGAGRRRNRPSAIVKPAMIQGRKRPRLFWKKRRPCLDWKTGHPSLEKKWAKCDRKLGRPSTKRKTSLNQKRKLDRPSMFGRIVAMYQFGKSA